MKIHSLISLFCCVLGHTWRCSGFNPGSEISPASHMAWITGIKPRSAMCKEIILPTGLYSSFYIITLWIYTLTKPTWSRKLRYKLQKGEDPTLERGKIQNETIKLGSYLGPKIWSLRLVTVLFLVIIWNKDLVQGLNLFIYFYFYLFFRPHLAMLRAYSWPYAQESLLISVQGTI